MREVASYIVTVRRIDGILQDYFSNESKNIGATYCGAQVVSCRKISRYYNLD